MHSGQPLRGASSVSRADSSFHGNNVNNLSLQFRFEVVPDIAERIVIARETAPLPHRRNDMCKLKQDVFKSGSGKLRMAAEGSENEPVTQRDDNFGGTGTVEMLVVLGFLALCDVFVGLILGDGSVDQ